MRWCLSKILPRWAEEEGPSVQVEAGPSVGLWTVHLSKQDRKWNKVEIQDGGRCGVGIFRSYLLVVSVFLSD
jgi:hypothetical protein